MLLKPLGIDDPRSPFVPDAMPSGYTAMELGEAGTFVTRNNQTQRLADFSAVMCSWSMFLSDESVFIHVLRNGQCFDLEITQAEQKSGNWILERLGAEAAGSVPCYSDLVGVILYFSTLALRDHRGGGGGDT
jgi:hypothetical protein